MMRRVAIVCAALLGLLVASLAGAANLNWNLDTYPIPSRNALPSRINITASGTIWVLEANANKLGKFDPAKKAFTEYDIPTHRSFPADLTTDGAGVVWFVEQDANQLGRFEDTRLSRGGAAELTRRLSCSER